jgi:hypothetical protein
MRDAAILEQTDHRRHTHGNAGGVQEVPVLFFGHGHALQHEDERAASGANVDGFVRSVQYEDGRKQSMAVSDAVSGRRREQAGG